MNFFIYVRDFGKIKSMPFYVFCRDVFEIALWKILRRRMCSICQFSASIDKFTYIPVHRICHRISKHLDKAAFDELVQLRKLVATSIDDILSLI